MTRSPDDIVDLVARARASADALDLERPRVGDLTGVLVFDLDVALDRALGLTRDLTAEDTLTLTRDLDRALALDFDLDRAEQREFVGNLELARRLAGELADALARVPEPPVDEVRAGKLSLWIVRAAVRALPSPDRLRYCEEFRAELADLAESDKSRCAQLVHALSLLAWCWPLRRALSGTVAELSKK